MSWQKPHVTTLAEGPSGFKTSSQGHCPLEVHIILHDAMSFDHIRLCCLIMSHNHADYYCAQ